MKQETKDAAVKATAAVAKHSGKINLALYSALIIFCANLLIDHGELKATAAWQEQSIESIAESYGELSDELDEAEDALRMCLVNRQ